MVPNREFFALNIDAPIKTGTANENLMATRLLEILSSLFRKREGAAPTNIAGAASSSSPLRVYQYGSPFSGGASDALTVGTVYRCVSLISGMVASLPLQYLHRNIDGQFKEVTSGRLHYLLRIQPDPLISAHIFWQMIATDLLLRGNAYALPVWSTTKLGELDRLIYIESRKVNHDTTRNKYTVNDPDNGIYDEFDEEEILHFIGMSLDGRNGVSVLRYAATTLGIAITGNDETLSRFQNGGNVRGIVSNDTSVRGFGEYQDTELEKTAVDLDERFQMGQRIVSLPGQVQFNQMSLSSVDMEFLSTRKWTVPEICRFYGVPPSFVFAESSSNYKSAEMENVALLSTTLDPFLKNIECELHRKLIAQNLCCKYKFNFDRREIHSCDLLGMAKYQAATIASGVYTLNDWRRRENQPEVEGGDEILISANLKSLKELLNPTTPAAPQDPKDPKDEDDDNDDDDDKNKE